MMDTRGHGEIMMTLPKGGLTPCRVLDRLSQYKSAIRAKWLEGALAKPQQHSSMIDANQGVYLGGSG
jgi:hypothetical protein